MPSPFFGQPFTFTQPDGSTLEVIGWGDQHHARFETPEGWTVARNPVSGWWEVAQASPDGMNLEALPGVRGAAAAAAAGVPRGLRLRPERTRALANEAALMLGGRRCETRRRERRQLEQALRTLGARAGVMRAPPQRGTVGDYVGLCLLIDFADAPGTIPREEVERFCNQRGYTGFGNRGSVHDYFLDNSLGRCRYTNLVTPYYRARREKGYYTNETIDQPIRARELINEALAHFKAQGLDFSGLTADAEDYVYAMNVYYAGGVMNNWSKGLWPHAFHMGTPVPLAAGRRAMDYQVTAMGNALTLGVFCHENGHMLCDYPDLYDYGGESSGVGGYCLMCGGANIDPRNPPQIGAYLKRLSGWAARVDPIEHGRSYTLGAGANEFALLARDGREYFLIEARQRAGRDAALRGEGLAIWHVDEAGSNNHEQMSATRHYECSLEQADGLFQLERDPATYGDPADLYAGPGARFAGDTTPASRWWDGSVSQLTVDTLSAAGAQMSFRCLLGDVAPPPAPLFLEATPNRTIPDNRPAGIGSVLTVDRSLLIGAVEVDLEIRHTWPADLVVSLQPPAGPAIVLHERAAGNVADGLKLTLDAARIGALATLRGRDAKGRWRLGVQDVAPADRGRLLRWALRVVPQAPVADGPQRLEEAPGTPIPDNDPAGITRTLHAGGGATLAGVEVQLDIGHTYIGDLRVSLVSPSGTEVLLHDRTGGTAENLVASYSAAGVPALAALAGQPMAGAWTLRIADLAGQDVGKLNRWGLTLRPA